MEIRNVTVMLMVDDTARADVALTPSRTYYRLATDSSIEDGELAPAPGYDELAASLSAAAATPGQPLARGVRMQVFVNNRITAASYTEEALRAVVGLLEPVAAEFAFLRGFIQ